MEDSIVNSIKTYPTLNLDMKHNVEDNHTFGVIHLNNEHYYVSMCNTPDHGNEFMAFHIKSYTNINNYEIDWNDIFVGHPQELRISFFITLCYEFVEYITSLEQTHREIIMQAIDSADLTKYDTDTLEKIYELLG